MRGIIILPKLDCYNEGFTITGNMVDPIKLRQYLLYWDKIDYPENKAIELIAPEIEYLKSIGVVERTFVKVDSFNYSMAANFFTSIQQTVFEYKTKNRKNEIWCIAQTNDRLFLPKEYKQEIKTIEVELIDSLPVPSGDIPFDDILNFKEKRYSELLSLRQAMDNLYVDLLKSEDIPRSKTIAIEKLQKNIIDLNRVMDESHIKRLLGSVKIDLNISDVLKYSLVSGAASTFLFDINPFIGAGIGALLSSVKISVPILPMPQNIPNDLKDFAYLYYQEKELR